MCKFDLAAKLESRRSTILWIKYKQHNIIFHHFNTDITTESFGKNMYLHHHSHSKQENLKTKY